MHDGGTRTGAPNRDHKIAELVVILFIKDLYRLARTRILESAPMQLGAPKPRALGFADLALGPEAQRTCPSLPRFLLRWLGLGR